MTDARRRFLVEVAPPGRDEAVFGELMRVHFGSGREPIGAVRVRLQALHDTAEAWLAQGRVQGGNSGGARFAADESFLFGTLDLDERDYPDFEAVVADAYERMRRVSMLHGYPYSVRTWSYFSGINEGYGDEERYRQFCCGRERGLGPAWFESEPAATVIGRPELSARFQLQWLAATQPGVAIDNPRQTPPHEYPREYGPTPPRFARGHLWRDARGAVLLISGTASVVGHRSMHPDQLRPQFEETERNLRVLLERAAGVLGRPAAFDAGTLLRVYVREAEHLYEVADLVRERFGPNVHAAILHGEVCRRELLVEIDGVHHFA